MAAGKTRLSIVVPCYNESAGIAELLQKFASVMGKEMELILVDNGSTDGSQEMMDREIESKHYAFAKVVRVEKNIGYGYGILSGLKAAKGEWLAFTHADLQCDPADVLKAYRKAVAAGKGNVLVKGHRSGRDSILTSGLQVIASIALLEEFDDINGQPKVFPRTLLAKFRNAPQDFSFDLYVQHLARMNGYAILPMPVVFAKRKHGSSHWSTGIVSRARTIAGYLRSILFIRLGLYN